MLSLLTEDDVAKELNLSLASLRRWRLEKRGPQFIKVGSLVRYRPEDIEVWLLSLPTGGSIKPAVRAQVGLSDARPTAAKTGV